MAEERDTTEMLHGIIADLDRGDGSSTDVAQLGTVVRDLATVADSLDQRLKRLEER